MFLTDMLPKGSSYQYFTILVSFPTARMLATTFRKNTNVDSIRLDMHLFSLIFLYYILSIEFIY
jgi:hypothetical protein